jgi:O-antigen ligase/branched-subunit amino acid transport protein AzlD
MGMSQSSSEKFSIHYSHARGNTRLANLTDLATIPNLVGLILGALAIVMLIKLPYPWNMRLPLYLIVFVWTALRPRMALYLMPIAVPWGSVDTLTLGGLDLNSADVLVGFLIIGWLLGFVLHPLTYRGRVGVDQIGVRDREEGHIPGYLIIAMLLMLGTMILSMAVAVDIRSSLKEIAKWSEFVIIVLLGAQYIRTRKQIYAIVVITILAGITQAFYGYLQDIFNLGPEAFIRASSLRVYGTFGQPNPFGGYINMPLAIALALMLLGRNWTTRICAGIATILLGLAVFLSQSKGAEMAAAAGLLFIIFVGMPRLRRPIGLVAIVGLVVVALFTLGRIPITVLNPLLKQVGLAGLSFTAPSAADYATAERIAHWIAGIRMFLAHPILGVGIGNFPDVYSHYYITIFTVSLDHAHDYYINTAAESGVVGLVGFLFFLMAHFVASGSSYLQINKRFREAKTQVTHRIPNFGQSLVRKDIIALVLHPVRMFDYYCPKDKYRNVRTLGNDRALALGLIAALLTVCVHNLVDDLYVHSMPNLIALLLILVIRLQWVTKQENEDRNLMDISNQERQREMITPVGVRG